MIRILFACVICLLAMTYPASARCYASSVHFFVGSESDMKMTVGSGKSCGFYILASGISRFDKLDIPARPKHGTALLRASGANYRANSGYKGEDEFTFAVTGVMKSGTGTARIRVHVTVN